MRDGQVNPEFARTVVDRSFLWLLAWAAVLYVPVLALVLVVAVMNAHGDEGVLRQLDRDGMETQATLIKQRDWQSLGYFSHALVSFTTESGAHVTTWVSTGSELADTAETRVRYSRSHPKKVRIVGHEHPHRNDWRFPVIAAAVLIILSAGTIVLLKHDYRIRLGE